MSTLSRLIILLLLLACLPLCTPAQKSKHEPELRTVRGQVLDKAETPVPAGVVFLKNMRTNAVRSYISDETGNYRFSGLDPNADYELHAEKDGVKSQTRTVSSYDSRKDMVLNLKLDKKS